VVLLTNFLVKGLYQCVYLKNCLGQRAMHHGTLLLNVDLTVMPKYLNPDKEKLKVKES
jgi:hypothetical protein